MARYGSRILYVILRKWSIGWNKNNKIKKIFCYKYWAHTIKRYFFSIFIKWKYKIFKVDNRFNHLILYINSLEVIANNLVKNYSKILFNKQIIWDKLVLIIHNLLSIMFFLPYQKKFKIITKRKWESNLHFCSL